MSDLSASHTPEARFVHNTGRDVEGVFRFPDDLAQRAVAYTHGGPTSIIIPDTLNNGLAQARRYVKRNLDEIIDTLHGEGGCAHCDGLCGLKEEDRPSGIRPTGFYLQIGVDRRDLDESYRPDKPIMATGVRCYSALMPVTPENHSFSAGVHVEKLPEGMQFDSRCYAMMTKIALSSFVLFDVALQRLEAVDL